MKLPLKPVTMKGVLLALLSMLATNLAADAQRSCVSNNYLQQQVQANPLLQQSIASAEAFIHAPGKESNTILLEGGPAELPVIKIPVVVHILYYSAAQNISDEQVQSQLAVLNRDFRRLNQDTANIPPVFKPLAADCRIEFSLATVDPMGRPTRGIVRRKTHIEYFNIDDRIKSTAIGGDDAWDANSYLNIWTGNLVGGMVGYASPIGFPKEKDGIVIHYSAFGAGGTAAAPYDKGRTVTHEIGHWLGLKHIWGDRYCGDDNVDDTPPQQTSSYGCPTGTVVTCSNAPFGNMYMNYMDLTYDACINLFTIGQRYRMRSLFNEGGVRHALLFSKGCHGSPLPAPAALPGDSVIHTAVTIFPNPVQRTVQIGIGDEQLMGEWVTLFDQLGKPVVQARITKNVTTIPVHFLKEGLYYVRVGGKVYKILKQ
jgi:hypothetical protein